ncbi:hypothetical protein ACFE04_002789 [Oxalis oulophora]
MATRQPHRQQAKQQQQQQQSKAVVVEKRKPVFIKVEQLKPGTSGHTMVVKVIESKTVLQKGRAASQHLRQTRIAECLIGDETGSILFTARNDQGNGIVLVADFGLKPKSGSGFKIDLMNEGATVILRNAKIDMFKGSMRLAVDKWGRIEATDPASFTVDQENNLSLVEYELVTVAEE